LNQRPRSYQDRALTS